VKIKEFCKKQKKKTILIAVLLVVILSLIAGAVFFFWSKKKDFSFPFNQGQGGFSMDGLSASGLTGVGITREDFEVEGLTEGILVEEVYVSSDTELQVGDKILKLSQDSIQEAREELEKLLRDADLAYRAGAIEYEQSKITVAYDRELAELSGKQAQAIYNESMQSLSDNVESAQQALDETNEQIAEYRAILGSEDLYATFKVGEYKALYDDNLKLLTTRMEEYGFTWKQVTSGGGAGGSMGGNMSGNMGDFTGSAPEGDQNPEQNMPMDTVSDSDALPDMGVESDSVSDSDAEADITSQMLYVCQSLYKVLEQNLQDYNQAQEDYEDAAANAKLNLQTLELSVDSLEEALSQAKANYEKQVLQVKLTLEQSLAEAERAEGDYEAAWEKAESDFETLKEAKEEAEANLALFENSVGDGYYYASQAGNIMRVNVRAGQYLTSESTIFMYTNPEEMTVSVSVDQSDVAKIKVGESVSVQSAEYGSFPGIVAEINPVSSSDSRTNVTYSVTVALQGDVGKLKTNETVTVIFGVGGTANEKED